MLSGRLLTMIYIEGRVVRPREVAMSNGTMLNVVKEIHRSNAPYSHGRRCVGGGCPAVYETDQGTYLVVGRRLSAEEKAKVSIDAIEDALEVPAELLASLVKKLQQ